jgi:hypothetical protein
MARQMARRRKSRTTKKARELDPEEVLAGRRSVTPEDLFRLIHQVNPTGLGHDRDEEIRLYRQKSDLQSRLIREHSEMLALRRGPGDGVVSLVHRLGQFDACHAVVDELEPDARSWVRHQLDTGDFERDSGVSNDSDAPWGPTTQRCRREEPARARTESEGDGVPTLDELVRRGRNAMRDFDYEAAEQYLTRALERSHGAVDAALPLLELWVGVLGMDGEALEAEPRLSGEAKAHPTARARLALAAARLGRDEHALELARGVEERHAAAVYAALTAQATRRGQADVAVGYLAEVKSRESTHPEIPDLERGIADLQARSARPAEEELLERYRREGPEAVEHDARALVDRWPESEVARRVLREAAARRREREIASCLEQAQRALGQERFHDAARHFREAIEAGCEREDLPALAERAETTAREREEQELFERVVGRFEGSADAAEALSAYLSLPKDLRPRVRGSVAHPALGWLDEMGAPASGSRANAAVAAALALEQAGESLSRGYPRDAVDLVSTHMRLLRHVEDARRCLEAAESRLSVERREDARRALGRAREAAEAGELEVARQHLSDVDVGELAAEDQAKAEELAALLRRAESREFLEREHDHHLANGDVLGALERAERLAVTAEAGDELWPRRVAELRGRIRRDWRVEVSNEASPLDELTDSFETLLKEEPQIWLDDEGRKLVLANAWDRWLFVRVIDVEKNQVVSRVSLRTPERLGVYLPPICLDGDRLRIVGKQGHLLELAWESWDVLRWFPFKGLLPPGENVEQEALVPASPYLWIASQPPRTMDRKLFVIDTQTERICRKVPGDVVHPLISPHASVVMVFGFHEGAKLYSVRGTPDREVRLPAAHEVHSIAVSPDGMGVWLLVVRADLDEERVELVALAPAADGALEVRRRLKICEIFEDEYPPLATLQGRGLGFVLAGLGDLNEILALADGGAPSESDLEQREFRQLFRVEAPDDTLLVQDRQGRHALALTLESRGVRIWPLGPEPPLPEFTDELSVPRSIRYIPRLGPPFFCDTLGEKDLQKVQAIARQMQTLGPEVVFRNYEETYADDVGVMVWVCHAGKRTAPEDPDWQERARELARRDPSHPGAAMLTADEAARRGAWKEVFEHLDAVDPAGLDESRQHHFQHLLGVALLHLDRPAEALAVLERAGGELSLCGVAALTQLARLLSGPPSLEEPGLSGVCRLVTMIRQFDRDLAAGDHEAARAALERPLLWQAGELQSAARLAEIYLLKPETDLFRKRQALAFFRHVYDPGNESPDLALSGLAWEASRLEEVAERARVWLAESVR